MRFEQINDEKFDALTKEAQASPRKRKNFNFHRSPDEPIQRMLNALEPETYARPHRHHGRPEVFLCLRGKALMVAFSDNGEIIEHAMIAPEGPTYGVEITPDTWHTVIALESGTVLYEVEQGPYNPATGKEFAAWSPEEKEEGAGKRFNEKILERLGIG